MADTEEKAMPSQTVASEQAGTGDVRLVGWKYRTRKIGPIRIPHYASPEVQLLMVAFVCFLCPGMFNALGGLGGGGQVSAKPSNDSNTALYSTFAFVGFFAGSITNWLGVRTALSFGGIGYCIYVAAYLNYDFNENYGFMVFAGALLGVCAGLLWAAQGAIIMSYPPEKLKGRYVAIFWAIFNVGAVLGSLIPLGQNIHVTSAKTVTNSTYIAFLVLTFLGACVALTLVDAKSVVRGDGSRVILMKNPTWKTELLGMWQTLLSEPYIVLLWPMFLASNWFYVYQFNDVNLARFNTRTRALNGTLYWSAQIFGAGIFGLALDSSRVRRSTRAKAGWAVLMVLTFAIWGGGYAFQKGYTRATAADDLLDWTSTGYVGKMWLYILYGMYDAGWQVFVYYIMGCLTNNGRKLANYAGFYKGIQSAGAAIMWRLDGLKVPYMNIFISCWVLLAGSLLIALPVMLLKIKDTVALEEDLKLSDETAEEVLGHKVLDDGPEVQKV